MDPEQSFDRTSIHRVANTVGKELFESVRKTNGSLFTTHTYRVPEYVRELNRSAYIPRVISIGPLHCKDAHLQTPMQDVKNQYAYCLFSRATEGMNNEDQKRMKKGVMLLEFVEKMKQCVDRAKKYYAEELNLVDDEMVKIMLVDGCFILELLYASYHTNKSKAAEAKTTNGRDSDNLKTLRSIPQPNGGEGSSGDEQLPDPILDSILIRNIVKQDLLLFENQIPFFVLEELFKLTVANIPDGNKLSLVDYVLLYFGDILRPEGINTKGENSGSKMNASCGSPSDCVLWVCGSTKESKPRKEEELKKVSGKANNFCHILHLLHERYPPPINEGENIVTEFVVSASDLHYAGVKFVSRKGNNLFDITFKPPKGISWWFHRAKFEIPTFNIHDGTETILRNLIAFEQCYPFVSQPFTCYARFMDTLIDSKEDVKVLKKAQVIRNHLGADDEVAELFNKLCKEVVVRDVYFNDKYQDAYKYSKHWCPNLMAHCKRKYFSSPWAFGAIIVAIIAFSMGVTQFVRSFLT